jgi:cysteinyl-tRNA synthetase
MVEKLKFYNTISRKKEVFKPIKEGEINLFVCGPTVYDNAHLGHAKTYIQFDVIARYLRVVGYKVFYLQNITDIDDKIINKAKEEGLGKDGWKKIKDKFEASYMEDMKRLGVVSVNKYARATSYIPEIISQVKRLIKKGYAYKISDGWYFDLSKDKDYGKLAGRTNLQEEDAISRIDENKEKKNKGDFCLWKFSKEGEPVWESDIGDGRPGWHIEDTAITEKEFGAQYDIHGGGMDLIFPHHEAEIAQMESISGKKPLVRCWMHTGFLEINAEKMGKSKKNFYTIKEVLAKGYLPAHLRYFFLSGNYRKPLNFTWESLDAAKNAYEKLKNILHGFKISNEKKNQKNIDAAYNEFLEFVNDDLNMPRGLSYMWDILRDDRLNKVEKYELVLKFDKVFGLGLDREEKIEIPSGLRELIKQREKSRKEKDFKTADKIREKINKLGFVVEDKEKGFSVKKR